MHHMLSGLVGVMAVVLTIWVLCGHLLTLLLWEWDHESQGQWVVKWKDFLYCMGNNRSWDRALFQ